MLLRKLESTQVLKHTLFKFEKNLCQESCIQINYIICSRKIQENPPPHLLLFTNFKVITVTVYLMNSNECTWYTETVGSVCTLV